MAQVDLTGITPVKEQIDLTGIISTPKVDLTGITDAPKVDLAGVAPERELPSPFARPLPSETPPPAFDAEPKTTLGFVEPKVTLGQFGKAVGTGVLSGGAILIDTLEKAQRIGEKSPLAPEITPRTKTQIEMLRPKKFSLEFKKARAKLKPRENAARAERIAFQAGEMFGQVVAGVTTGAPLSTLSLASGTSKMDEVITEGGSYWKGLGAGTAQALVEYATEKIPLGELSKIAKGKTKHILKSSLTAIVSDVFGEVAANAIERGAIDPTFLDRKAPEMNQLFEESVDIAIATLLGTAGLAVGAKAISKAKRAGITPPTIPPTQIQAPEVFEEIPSKVQIPLDKELMATLPLAEAPTISTAREPVRVVDGKLPPDIPPGQIAAEDAAILQEVKDRLADVNNKLSKLRDTADDAFKAKHLHSQRRFLEKKVRDLTPEVPLPLPPIPPAAQSVVELVEQPVSEVVTGEIAGVDKLSKLKEMRDRQEVLSFAAETKGEQVKATILASRLDTLITREEAKIQASTTTTVEKAAMPKEVDVPVAKVPFVSEPVGQTPAEAQNVVVGELPFPLIDKEPALIPAKIKGKNTLHPEMKAILESRGKLEPADLENDIYNVEAADSGKPLTLIGFRGSGRADKAAIFAEGITESVLGDDAKYIALNRKEASVFGPTVKKEKIILKNPLIITSDAELSSLFGGGPIPMDNEARKPLLKATRKKLDTLGYDGVIVNVPIHADVNSKGRPVKRLREIFGITQVVVFPKKPFPTAAESVVVGELPPPPRKGERGAIDMFVPTPPVTATKKEVSRVKNFITLFKEFWAPLSTIPQSEEFLAKRYRTMGKMYQVERIVGKIAKKAEKLSSKANYNIFRYMNAEIPIEDLTLEQRVIAKSFQNSFNIAGKMAVKRGMLDEATYEKHKNQYIPYLYLRHVLDDSSPVGISSSGKLDLSYQIARKDMTKKKRRELGLIEDVSVAAPVGLGRLLSDVVKYDQYAEIADNPNWTFAPSRVFVDGKKMGIGELAEEVKIAEKMNKQAPNVPEIKERLDALTNALETATEMSQNIPDEFVKMPVSKKWGELSGAFVRKEIARDLLSGAPIIGKTNSMSRIVNYILAIDAKAMAAFKVGKVALNPPTMVRNMVSNLLQQRMYGISFHQQPKLMLTTTLAWKNRHPWLVQFERMGGFKTNWSEAEINKVLNSVKTMQKENDVVAGLKKMAGFYGKIDDFFKFNIFVYNKMRGVPTEKAMLDAQKWTMDYTRIHPSVELAREHVMPMITYQYKIVPLIAETAVKRPWVLASLLAIPALMTALAVRKLNLTDEEFKKAKKELPTFLRETGAYAPMLWRDDAGRIQWINMEYYFPWANLANVGRDLKAGEYGELMGDFGVGSPVIDTISMFKTTKRDDPPKDPYTGIDVYSRLDSPTVKALKLGEWFYNRWAPSWLTRYGTLGKTLRIGERDKYGREMTAGKAGASLFGANIIAPTQQQALAERYVRTKELQLSLSRILRDPTVPEEEKQRAIVEFNKQINVISGQ
jgi:hypothetical protein